MASIGGSIKDILKIDTVASFCWKSRGLQENYLIPQFSRYWDPVFCILLTTKLSIKILNRFFKFCLIDFLQSSEVKKNF